MLWVRLDRLLEAEEGVIDCNCASPRLLGLGPFAPWSANVVLGHLLYILEPFNSHDYIDVISGLPGLERGFNIIVGSKSPRDEFGRFLLGDRLNSHPFEDRFTRRITAY